MRNRRRKAGGRTKVERARAMWEWQVQEETRKPPKLPLELLVDN